MQAAARVRPDRLVVGLLRRRVAAELVDALGAVLDGVLAGGCAPTLRQAVLRLPATSPPAGPGYASARRSGWRRVRPRGRGRRASRWPPPGPSQSAELGIEGSRVTLRDIFTFTIERTAAGGAIEGSFNPTGVVPAIVEDLAARGTASTSPSSTSRQERQRCAVALTAPRRRGNLEQR